MTAQPLLSVNKIGKRFGGFVVLDYVEFVVHPGERLGLIGPNGSGKSTTVNCLSGVLRQDTGSIVFDGQVLDQLPPHERAYAGLVRSFKIPKPFRRLTVLKNILVHMMFAAKKRMGRHLNLNELQDKAHEALSRVGLIEKTLLMAASLT